MLFFRFFATLRKICKHLINRMLCRKFRYRAGDKIALDLSSSRVDLCRPDRLSVYVDSVSIINRQSFLALDHQGSDSAAGIQYRAVFGVISFCQFHQRSCQTRMQRGRQTLLAVGKAFIRYRIKFQTRIKSPVF